jgi:RNA polymerase sigma-70 factor (ECF subfamily)
MTDSTPHSLLQRLRENPDEDGWKRLVDLYAPLLQRWLAQTGIAGPDADDLLQEVFVSVVREMPSFHHNQRRGAFRSWLRTILVHRVRGHLRRRRGSPQSAADLDIPETLDRLEDQSSDLSRLWDREHDEFVVRLLLQLIEPEFATTTWQAFRRLVIDGQDPEDVAKELGLSIHSVYAAKSRVLRRMRREIEGLIN